MKKYLVDTCGWVEWLTAGKLAGSFEPYLKQMEQLIVPTLVQYELYKWLCREKDSTIALEMIGFTENAVVIPLESSLALFAAELSRHHQLAMADAIIYATAQMHHAELITSDSHFKNLSQVKFFSKAS